MLYGMAVFIFFLFLFSFFSATILSGPYLWNRYSQRLQIECAAWSPGLIELCCLPSNSLRYFLLFFILLFFSAKILSGPYLWNGCSQRLQIQYAAWSFGLILHCCLPSNALCYFFSATILSGPYLWNRYSQRLQIECAAWSCCLIFALLLTMQFASLFFFPPRFCPGHISGTVTRRDSKLSVVLGPVV